MAAHQAPPSLGFSRQEHWTGLPFPSPMHESEKWKWSRSVMHVPLLATSWTAAYQAPPSTGFSRQEYGSGVPLSGGSQTRYAKSIFDSWWVRVIFKPSVILYWSIPWWLRWWRIHLPFRRCRFKSWVRKIPWRRDWQPTPVFLPGEFHGAWQAIVHEVAKSQTQLSNSHFHFHKKNNNNNQCIKLFAPTFRSHYIFLVTLANFYIYISVPFHTIKLFQTICVHFELMFTCQFVEANCGFIAFSLQMAGNPNKFAVTISTWKLNQFWMVLWSSAFWSKCISIRIWMCSCCSGYSKPFELFICITQKNMTRYLSFGSIAH